MSTSVRRAAASVSSFAPRIPSSAAFAFAAPADAAAEEEEEEGEERRRRIDEANSCLLAMARRTSSSASPITEEDDGGGGGGAGGGYRSFGSISTKRSGGGDDGRSSRFIEFDGISVDDTFASPTADFLSYPSLSSSNIITRVVKVVEVRQLHRRRWTRSSSSRDRCMQADAEHEICTEPLMNSWWKFVTQYVLRKDTAGDTLSFFFSDEG
jgi:hypothetical protein